MVDGAPASSAASASTPLVSVILPHHNRRDVLPQAVASVLGQTLQDLELILVDDGSTDGSDDVVAAIEDPRVVVISLTRNRGVCAARNAGMEAAGGRYLSFQDSDDIWHRNKLERQVAWITTLQDEGHDTVSMVSCCGRIDGTHIIEGAPHLAPGPYGWVDVLTGRLRERTPMLLVDRERIAPGAHFDPSFPAVVERDFMLSALANGSTVGLMDEVLMTIRRGRGDHVANATRALDAYVRYMDKYEPEMREHPDIAAWYAFQALRSALRARQLRRASQLLWPARPAVGWRLAPHVLAGIAWPARGMNAAQRLLPVQPPVPATPRRAEAER